MGYGSAQNADKNIHQIVEWNWDTAVNPKTSSGGTVLKTIRSYTYFKDPFLNSINLKDVNLIDSDAFSGARAIREFYSSASNLGAMFNKGLNKVLWGKYANHLAVEDEGTRYHSLRTEET